MTMGNSAQEDPDEEWVVTVVTRSKPGSSQGKKGEEKSHPLFSVEIFMGVLF